jgi:hypothetical protein
MNNIETLPSVYEDSKTKCTEDCWIVGEQRKTERVIKLIQLKYNIHLVKYQGKTPWTINIYLKNEGEEEGKTDPLQGWVQVRGRGKWRGQGGRMWSCIFYLYMKIGQWNLLKLY